jgi:DNA repair exonuclease SbcCD ATPase subunit
VIDREIATLEERARSLIKFQEMLRAISELEEQAGALQGRIDRLRSRIEDERSRLRFADENAHAIAEKFKTIMLNVGFPGVSDEDEVVLSPRNWKPIVVHAGQEWGFWETGSGGKKTLFNVCYALAVHEVAQEREMPVPSILIIDSPTKNISDDENLELVQSLYREIYRIAASSTVAGMQFLLIDSDLVEPGAEFISFAQRRMAGEPDAPSLISYYVGP